MARIKSRTERRAEHRRLVEHRRASQGGGSTGTGGGGASGGSAEKPSEIPARGWRDVLMRVKDEVGKDNIGLVAAGVAFYALLAIFPALAALVAIFGMVMDPAELQNQTQALAGIVPEAALSIIQGQLAAVASAGGGKLSLVAIGSILLALWSATKGTKAMMTALNIAYDEEEQRGFFKLNVVALLLTVGAILGVIVTLAAIVVAPALLGNLGLGDAVQSAISLLRWPLLLILAIIGMAFLYRYGPSRDAARWRWVSWGAAGSVVVWIVASGLFSWYVSNFDSYNKTYGSLGAVVILLMWFYISAYVFLLGAEINGEMEHQTARDTTAGPEKPMGERGAYAADHVATAR
ncbi:MAG: YihY/virulence factor BrkB family protein [Rhodospirillales bacterium]|nr:YihY/virulence factor BrkB family protein [Rhodospirillales bacterium]